MKRNLVFCLTAALLLSTVQRAPAPISEVETPTPAPKRTIKHKESENSQSPTKRQTPLPPQTKATSQQNPFDGTWVGKCDIPQIHNVDLTLIISGRGTRVDVKMTDMYKEWGIANHDNSYTSKKPTCDGATVRFDDGWGRWVLTPNSDGKTAHFTCDWPGFLLMPACHSSATFQKALR